jgi:hypothetical protein
MHRPEGLTSTANSCYPLARASTARGEETMNEMLDETMKGTSEDSELVELGDASEVTMGPNWGPWIDAGGWPKPF